MQRVRSLGGNRLTTLPPLEKLEYVRELYLHDNNFRVVPIDVPRLRTLRRLSLSGNHLTELPTSIGELVHLERLACGGNRLTSLPASIGALGKLESLFVDGNQLFDLPPEFAELQNLRTLEMSNNLFETFPAPILELTELHDLRLRSNLLKSLPSLRQMRKLRLFQADGNPGDMVANLGALHLMEDLGCRVTLPKAIAARFRNEQSSALHFCAQYNLEEEADKLVNWRRNSQMLWHRDSRGQTPLHVACRHGHVRFALRIIRAGCPVDVQDNNGRLASELIGMDKWIDWCSTSSAVDAAILHWHATGNCYREMHALLEAHDQEVLGTLMRYRAEAIPAYMKATGALIKKYKMAKHADFGLGSDCRWLNTIASWRRQLWFFRDSFIIEDADVVKALKRAALYGTGEDVPGRPYTLLAAHAAAMKGDPDKVLEFLHAGQLGLDVRDTQGKNVLHVAAEYGHLDVLRAVLDRARSLSPDVDRDLFINVPDNEGYRPLYYALASGHVECVRFIVDNRGLCGLCTPPQSPLDLAISIKTLEKAKAREAKASAEVKKAVEMHQMSSSTRQLTTFVPKKMVKVGDAPGKKKSKTKEKNPFLEDEDEDESSSEAESSAEVDDAFGSSMNLDKQIQAMKDARAEKAGAEIVSGPKGKKAAKARKSAKKGAHRHHHKHKHRMDKPKTSAVDDDETYAVALRVVREQETEVRFAEAMLEAGMCIESSSTIVAARERLDVATAQLEFLRQRLPGVRRMRTHFAIRSFFSHATRHMIFLLILVVTIIHFNTNVDLVSETMEHAVKQPLVATPIGNADDPTRTFHGMQSVSDFWLFMEGPFLETVYAELDSNGNPLPVEDRSFIHARHNYIVGMARLRQLRVQNGSCSIPDAWSDVMDENDCFSAFSGGNEEKGDFGPSGRYKWTSDGGGVTIPANTRWWQRFPTSGYVKDLQIGDRFNATTELAQLRSDYWLGRATRLVTVTLTVYNPNVNMLVDARLIVEFDETGAVLPWTDVTAIRSSFYSSPVDYFVLVCEIVVVLITLGRFFFGVRDVLRHSTFRRHFHSFWNTYDVFFFLALLLLFIFRAAMVLSVNTISIQPTEERFFDIATTARLAVYANSLAGPVIAMGFLRTLRYVVFLPVVGSLIAAVGDTLKSRTVLVFGVAIAFVLFAFSVALKVALGGDFGEHVLAVSHTPIGSYPQWVLDATGAPTFLGNVVFISFAAAVMLLLLTYVAVIGTIYKRKLATAETKFEEHLTERMGRQISWPGYMQPLIVEMELYIVDQIACDRFHDRPLFTAGGGVSNAQRLHADDEPGPDGHSELTDRARPSHKEIRQLRKTGGKPHVKNLPPQEVVNPTMPSRRPAPLPPLAHK